MTVLLQLGIADLYAYLTNDTKMKHFVVSK